MMAGSTEVQYLVLPDATNPYLLARVRWPDVSQAISPARPYWQVDPGLFDLPYEPTGTTVTLDEAAAIAAEWGAQLPTDEDARASAYSLIRRMPADWSDLSPGEKRAWAIVPGKAGNAASEQAPAVQAGKPVAAEAEPARGRRTAVSGSRLMGWRSRWRRQTVSPAVDRSELPQIQPVSTMIDPDADVLDLTDGRQDALATVEDA